MREEVFAKGFCFKKVFFCFLIGCIVGCYYEELLLIIKKGFWEPRRGLVIGPFSPVYGISIAVILIIFGKKLEKLSAIRTYIYCFFLGGIMEYILSVIQQFVFHSRSWNYNGYFLNIDGRTTIPFMFFWGFLGCFFLKMIYPFLSNLIEKIPYKTGEFFYICLLIFMIFNISLTLTVTIRQVNRRKGLEPKTIIGKLSDKYYPDEVISKIYPNSVYEVD